MGESTKGGIPRLCIDIDTAPGKRMRGGTHSRVYPTVHTRVRDSDTVSAPPKNLTATPYVTLLSDAGVNSTVQALYEHHRVRSRVTENVQPWARTQPQPPGGFAEGHRLVSSGQQLPPHQGWGGQATSPEPTSSAEKANPGSYTGFPRPPC